MDFTSFNRWAYVGYNLLDTLGAYKCESLLVSAPEHPTATSSGHHVVLVMVVKKSKLNQQYFKTVYLHIVKSE